MSFISGLIEDAIDDAGLKQDLRPVLDDIDLIEKGLVAIVKDAKAVLAKYGITDSASLRSALTPKN